tara:strand:+ start:84 stop:248 length:165 start_codon:yes stop_codon:yes gene_type:complete
MDQQDKQVLLVLSDLSGLLDQPDQQEHKDLLERMATDTHQIRLLQFLLLLVKKL